MQALGLAAVKACACIVGIIAGGRLLIQPLYKKMSAFANAEVCCMLMIDSLVYGCMQGVQCQSVMIHCSSTWHHTWHSRSLRVATAQPCVSTSESCCSNNWHAYRSCGSLQTGRQSYLMSTSLCDALIPPASTACLPADLCRDHPASGAGHIRAHLPGRAVTGSGCLPGRPADR